MMGTAAVSQKAERPGPKWSRQARANVFAVLRAVYDLVPKVTEDSAVSSVAIAALAERAGSGISRNAVCESLRFLQAWRVVWLGRQRTGTVEIRFNPRVVLGLLTAERVVAGEVGILMVRYRARREAIAPWLPRLHRGKQVLAAEMFEKNV